ncbi:MAG: DUF2779 domain-containing protein [Dehalococcoidia bacterium]|nr:DUF2779 domain-containing protein [Dehalococcoidia bacterium]
MTDAQLPPVLSKCRFQTGLQCLKRLYLECYHHELADPVDAGLQARFDTGNAVGEVARQRFPNGRLIEESHLEHDRAVRTTRDLLDDATIPALYEAAFTFQCIRMRSDVLKRNGLGEFDLVEVKSTTGVKPEHITDVAIQVYASEGSGVPIKRAYLMHLNNAYVYQGGDHDLEQLFTLEDVTEKARRFVAENVPEDLARMWATLQLDVAPDIETGRHCTRPYTCSFFGYCHQDEAEHPIRELLQLKERDRESLRASGILDIGSIPADFPGLSSLQRRMRDSVVSGRSSISPELGPKLREVTFPASFLDFETIMQAIPLYVGTRPYQTIPFQWSLHVRDSYRQIRHDSFLNHDARDPRERFVTRLLEAIPPEGSIIAYSTYERTIMRELAQAFPQYEDRLLALCDRMVDLLKLVRDNYYHPEFHGSYSLKSVLPVLVPGLSYADMEIPEGLAASMSYARMVAAETPEAERAKIREALLAYCQRDTEAMVRVYDALLAEAGGNP